MIKSPYEIYDDSKNATKIYLMKLKLPLENTAFLCPLKYILELL